MRSLSRAESASGAHAVRVLDVGAAELVASRHRLAQLRALSARARPAPHPPARPPHRFVLTNAFARCPLACVCCTCALCAHYLCVVNIEYSYILVHCRLDIQCKVQYIYIYIYIYTLLYSSISDKCPVITLFERYTYCTSV